MGSIQIGTDRGAYILQQLYNEEPDLYKKVHLRHYFNEFSFGDRDHMEHIKKEFAEYPEHLVFDPAHIHDHKSNADHTEAIN